jgi:hypothetical protein
MYEGIKKRIVKRQVSCVDEITFAWAGRYAARHCCKRFMGRIASIMNREREGVKVLLRFKIGYASSRLSGGRT